MRDHFEYTPQALSVCKAQCSDKIRGWPCYWLFSGQGSSMWHVFAQLTLTGTLVTQHSFTHCQWTM